MEYFVYFKIFLAEKKLNLNLCFSFFFKMVYFTILSFFRLFRMGLVPSCPNFQSVKICDARRPHTPPSISFGSFWGFIQGFRHYFIGITNSWSWCWLHFTNQSLCLLLVLGCTHSSWLFLILWYYPALAWITERMFCDVPEK